MEITTVVACLVALGMLAAVRALLFVRERGKGSAPEDAALFFVRHAPARAARDKSRPESLAS